MPFLHFVIPERSKTSGYRHGFLRSAQLIQHRGILSDSATDHIGLAREVAEILRQHDVVVETILTDRPGFLVYEDDFQIVAEPFSETPT
jgi:hypothetical protein